jgi:hypothetical protein
MTDGSRTRRRSYEPWASVEQTTSEHVGLDLGLHPVLA